MYYKNFVNATYAPAPYLNDTELCDIENDIKKTARYVKFDKIYLETFRSDILVARDKMLAVKQLFKEYGYSAAGGITPTVKGALMGCMCFSNRETRERLGDIAAYTAELFDEVILDDFYFTNCRCEACIKAKGERSWAEFRLALMNDISENTVIKRAKEANRNVSVIIKYPNWYESYQDTGYNPQDETLMFDGIYTGTETRDPHYPHQNLQRYLSYFLPRLMENISPGRNGGGWYDLFECNLDDYVQQAYLTLFAKCRENMLFCFPLMVKSPSVYMAAAGAVYDDADELMGKLGNPYGIACYKPYHSHEERHLYDYIGMLGIPLEPYPTYPKDAPVIILTAASAYDKDIADKIRQSLINGSRVVLTSGLYEKLQTNASGIRSLLPLEVTGRSVSSNTFTVCPYGANNAGSVTALGDITLPRITYSTNDMWVLAAAQTPFESNPLLLCGDYGKGRLYVLNIPDLKADLYKLPAEVLTALRRELNIPVILECDARIGLFLYDNDTFILSSFASRPMHVHFSFNTPNVEVTPLNKNIMLKKTRAVREESVFEVLIMPGWYAAFKFTVN